MAAHFLTPIPAVYAYPLRPDPGVVGEDAATADNGTQIPLQLRRGTGYMDGYWTCGASGHVEAAESVLEAALHGADEELGIGVEATDLSAPTAMHRINDLGGAALKQRVDLFFMLRTWTGTLAVCESTRNAGLCWFSLVNLPEVVPLYERYILELLAASLDGGKPVPPVTTFSSDKGQGIDHYNVALPC